MSLRRFFERLFWLCMLPLLVTGLMLVATQVHVLEEQRSLAEQSLVRGVARDLDHMLELRVSSLELLARAMPEQALDPSGRLNAARARTLAEHHVELRGSHVMISSASGTMLMNTRFPKDLALPSEPTLPGIATVGRAISTRSKVVSDAFFGPMAGRELIGLAVPMPLVFAEPLGIMSAIEIADIQRRIESFHVPLAWSLTVTDGAGRVMAHLGAENPTPDGPAFIDETRVVRVSLTQAPWTVTLHAPPASVLDSAKRQAGLLILALCLSVALAYWAGRMASQRLTRSMMSLAEPINTALQVGEEIEEVRQVRQRILLLQHERLEAQERERQRIGLELHDDLQQRLAVLRNDVALWLRQKPGIEAAAAGAPSPILSRIDETIAATRHVVNELRPQVLDDFGVALGLRLLAQRMRESHGLNIDLQLLAEERSEHLPKPVATALYRVTQEALNNVRKHAQASVVHVTLDLRAPDAAELEIMDDGVGFEVLSSETPESHGLRGMLERVQALRGSLKIESQPGEGTAILVRLPIVPPDTSQTPSDPTPTPTTALPSTAQAQTAASPPAEPPKTGHTDR